MELQLEQRPMRMCYLLSLFIHAALLMIIFVACASDVKKSPEMVTVVLNNQVFVAGDSGGDGKTPGSQVIEKKGERIGREVPRVKRHHKALLTNKTEEVGKKPPIQDDENTIPSNESSDLALLGKPMQASADFDADESGIGLGGGGKGVGGYGSGSGFGGKGTGGTGGDGKGYGTGQSEEYKLRMQYLKEHFNYIRDLIMRNLTYPLQAKKMGWKGQVTVSFIISEEGTVERIRIIRSSGHKILDENVAFTIREVQPFPKPPVRAEIIIPVAYSLG